MSKLALGEEVISWSRNDLEQLVMNKIVEESLARAITSQEKGVLAGPRLGKHYACLSCGSVPGRD